MQGLRDNKITNVSKHWMSLNICNKDVYWREMFANWNENQSGTNNFVTTKKQEKVRVEQRKFRNRLFGRFIIFKFVHSMLA